MKPPVIANIVLADNAFVCQNQDGHTLTLDSNRTQGMSPMESILCALAGCALVDVKGILEKQKEPTEGLACHVLGVRADAVPAVFTHISLEFVARGVDPKRLAKAVALSKDKYCSVSRMLTQGDVQIDATSKVLGNDL